MTRQGGPVLDAIMVEAAVAAGAGLRQGFAVEAVVFDGDSALRRRRSVVP